MCASADREALVAHLALPGLRAGQRERSRRQAGEGWFARQWSGCPRGARLLRELAEPAQRALPIPARRSASPSGPVLIDEWRCARSRMEGGRCTDARYENPVGGEA